MAGLLAKYCSLHRLTFFVSAESLETFLMWSVFSFSRFLMLLAFSKNQMQFWSSWPYWIHFVCLFVCLKKRKMKNDKTNTKTPAKNLPMSKPRHRFRWNERQVHCITWSRSFWSSRIFSCISLLPFFMLSITHSSIPWKKLQNEKQDGKKSSRYDEKQLKEREGGNHSHYLVKED